MSKDIYFFSDPHAYHKNICRGSTSWKVQEEGSNHQVQSLRDFDNAEEMTQALVQSINSVVKWDDTAYCLGDWSFAGHENVKKFRDQLHCRDIHLIFGNHDQHITPINSPYRSLFSSCDYYKELDLKIDSMKSGKYGKTKIVLFHYAMRVWNQSHHSAILLYAHSHGSLPGIGKSMDVGVDTNNLYPYHLDEIIEKMKHIPINFVDHHADATN